MIMILLACFLCVWIVDTPVADAASKKQIKKYNKCIEKGTDTCIAAYDACPDKIRDVELKSFAKGEMTQPEFMKKMESVDEKCFKNLVKCNEGYDKLCGNMLK
jgi:hypothetical protein